MPSEAEMRQSRALLYTFPDGEQKGVLSAVAEAVSDEEELNRGWLTSTHVLKLQQILDLLLKALKRLEADTEAETGDDQATRTNTDLFLGTVRLQAVLATYPGEGSTVLVEDRAGRNVIFHVQNEEDWVALLGLAAPGATMETQSQAIISVLPECLRKMRGRTYDLPFRDVTN